MRLDPPKKPNPTTPHGVDSWKLLLLAGAVAAWTTAASAGTPPATPTGLISAKGYLNIGGTTVGDLTGNAKYPDHPDVAYYYPYFEWNAAGDINTPANNGYGDNYGAIMQGYFYPPATGDYVFWTCSDDSSNLYLSTDSDPANKKLIAQEQGWSNPRAWDTAQGGALEAKNSSTFTGSQWPTKDAANGGAKITLTKNKPYYIEAILKEGGGGDNLAVAVQAPDGSIDQTMPIPGKYLSPFAVASAATILAQPQDVAVYAGSTANFSVGLDLPPGVTLTNIKWTKNGTDIPNSNVSTLALPVTAADNGAKIKAIVTTSAGVLTSTEATATVATFTSDFAQGVVKFEAYNNIGSGTAVDNLTSDPKYPDKPDDVRLLTGIDSPNGYGDNYGARVSGFIIPPETGSYRFFLRSDDASQFWLSTDDTVAKAVMVAEETGCCNAFTEPDSARTSEPISLVAGKKYAFYALLKEGGGGDYVQVAARKEGDTTAAGSLQPLSGAWVGANAKPSLGDPQITQQPQALPRLIEGNTGILKVAASVTPAAYNFPALIQWQKNGQNIAGANSATYKIANAKAADSGTYRAVVSAPSGKSVTSTEVTVAVVPDTFPPEPSVSALKNPDNTYDVGVAFDEPVDAAATVQANYSISGGTVTKFTPYPKSPGAVLTVSGLSPGTKYTVTVKNVADAKGNKITSVSKDFTVGKMAWGVVGADRLKLGNGVMTVGDTGFDIYSDGATEWNNYDEATFVYEQITGDFDKKVRVEYQDSSSQWARAGLIVRDVTNFGVNDAAQAGSQTIDSNSGTAPFDGKAGRYQKVHVNPVTTVMGTAGNNSWEGNRRLVTGGPCTSAGGGGTPQYPNAWCRLSRKGDLFTIYRSDDGVNWTQLGTTTFPDPMPATLYVGPEFSPENGNISDESLRGVWLAKLREYGDTFGSTGGTPTLALARAANGVTLTFTGTLQSADSVAGPWADVAGSSPQTITATGKAKFFRTKQ